MMVSRNSTVACSPFIELRNEFDLYEHSLLPQANNIRQELSGVGSRNMISLQEPTVLLMCCKLLKK
jgi:hypothetical protein